MFIGQARRWRAGQQHPEMCQRPPAGHVCDLPPDALVVKAARKPNGHALGAPLNSCIPDFPQQFGQQWDRTAARSDVEPNHHLREHNGKLAETARRSSGTVTQPADGLK